MKRQMCIGVGRGIDFRDSRRGKVYELDVCI
jgi:hypothetical protein